MALINAAQFLELEPLAEIMELLVHRQRYPSVSATAAQVPGELTSKMCATRLPLGGEIVRVIRSRASVDKRHPCPLSTFIVNVVVRHCTFDIGAAHVPGTHFCNAIYGDGEVELKFGSVQG